MSESENAVDLWRWWDLLEFSLHS